MSRHWASEPSMRKNSVAESTKPWYNAPALRSSVNFHEHGLGRRNLLPHHFTTSHDDKLEQLGTKPFRYSGEEDQ